MKTITTRRTTIALLLTALAFAGCGSRGPQKLDKQGIASLHGKAIVIATPASQPDFMEFTPGRAALGMLGEAEMRREGNRIVTSNNIANPAVGIAQEVARALGASAGVKFNEAAAVITSDDESAAGLSGKAGGAGLVLAIRTRDWRTWYYTTNFIRYRVRIDLDARLIDAATKTVIARARCDESSPIAADASPTYFEMVGNGALRLKEELAKAQASCAAKMKQALLGA